MKFQHRRKTKGRRDSQTATYETGQVEGRKKKAVLEDETKEEALKRY
jgi:hypothetical protein